MTFVSEFPYFIQLILVMLPPLPPCLYESPLLSCNCNQLLVLPVQFWPAVSETEQLILYYCLLTTALPRANPFTHIYLAQDHVTASACRCPASVRGFTHRSASCFGSIFFSRLIHSNIKSKQSQFTLPVFSLRHLGDKLWLFFQITSRGQSNQITVLRFLPGLWVSINIWYVFTSLKAFDLRAGSLCCTVMMPLHCAIRCPSVTADLKLTLPWPTFPVRPHQTLKPPDQNELKWPPDIL